MISPEEQYANIRDFLQYVVGKTIIDVTQHDKEDYDPSTHKGAYVMLLFNDGSSIKFPVGDEPIEGVEVVDDDEAGDNKVHLA